MAVAAELQTVAVVVHGLYEWAETEWVAAAAHPGVRDVVVVNHPGRHERLMLLRLNSMSSCREGKILECCGGRYNERGLYENIHRSNARLHLG